MIVFIGFKNGFVVFFGVSVYCMVKVFEFYFVCCLVFEGVLDGICVNVVNFDVVLCGFWIWFGNWFKEWV